MNRADPRRFPTRPPRARVAAFLGLFLAGALPLFAASPEPAGTEPLRFAFSSRMFTEVNENGARASVKAWGLAIARERGIAIDAQPIILSGQAEITEAVRRKTIDGAAVLAEEYFRLPPELKAKKGTLYKYIKNVKSASEGCVTDA